MSIKNLILLAGVIALPGSALVAADSDTSTKTTDSTKTSAKAVRPDREAMRAYHQKVLSIYDENGDGVLDEIEHAVLKADIASGAIEPPPGRPLGQGRRHLGPPPEIVEQYDANDDGVLDETERAALHADIESGKITLPVPAHPEGRGQGRGLHVKPETDESAES